MRCAEFESRLEALLEDALSPAETSRCLAHLEDCSSCGDLMELAGGSTAASPVPEAPGELVAAVLAETSGGACGQALEELCRLVDETLSGADRELLELHLASCSECAGTAAVLRAMGADLPLLAEWRPDPGFVDDVLAATLPVEVRLRRWWQKSWPRWVHRPRFAMETAYIASLVLMLVFLTPGSPLAAMPERALNIVTADPVARFEPPLGALGQWAEGRARETWRVTGAPVVAATETVGLELTDRGEVLVARISTQLRTVRDGLASLLEEDGGGEEESPTDIESEEETS